LSLQLLIDEDCQAKPLISLLKKAGHDVITANEAGLAGKEDYLVLDYAIAENRVLLSQNCDDFQALHQEKPHHPGILVIYQNDLRSKNMVSVQGGREESGFQPVDGAELAIAAKS
jgi:predicted nuclease of predicted toxin-antitoxin system